MIYIYIYVYKLETYMKHMFYPLVLKHGWLENPPTKCWKMSGAFRRLPRPLHRPVVHPRRRWKCHPRSAGWEKPWFERDIHRKTRGKTHGKVEVYPLGNVDISRAGQSPCMLGKSTISTGPWLQLQSVNVYQRAFWGI